MLNRLLGALGSSTDDEAVVTPEEEKAQRIEWHRRNVRNGPARFTALSQGRAESRDRRRREAAQRKVNVKHRRRWIGEQRGRAVLRGQLQALGTLPYADPDFKPTLRMRLEAGQWIVRRFGERDKDGVLVLSDTLLPDAAQAAYQAYVGKR